MFAVKAKHLVPNVVTLANIAFGFLSMAAAAEGQFTRACAMLFFATLCDTADGKLARFLDASSKFGMELDSLSDMVSFGLAPAMLVYQSVLKSLGPLGQGIAVAFALCGALRLARFNVDSGSKLSDVSFQGVPIPGAAGYVISFVLVRDSLHPYVVACGTLAMAICMVSTLKVPKFRKGGLPSWLLYVCLALSLGVLIRPSALTWHVWNGWNCMLVIINYVVLGRKGLLVKRERPQLRRAA
jgi:CDP-diacylglycerol--serine O-phosphatidyltransferase